ncbi:MAG: hypothetical protein ABIK43_02530 [candidate division WOR-3 bacterium]
MLPDTEDTLYFPDWVAAPAGLLTVTSYTLLPGDGEPGNDTARTTVLVNPPQGEGEVHKNPVVRLTVSPFTSRGFVAEWEVPAGTTAVLKIT